jgi:hypothetical protein
MRKLKEGDRVVYTYKAPYYTGIITWTDSRYAYVKRDDGKRGKDTMDGSWIVRLDNVALIPNQWIGGVRRKHYV